MASVWTYKLCKSQDILGCPYRHLDEDALSQRLQRCGLNRDQITKVLNTMFLRAI